MKIIISSILMIIITGCAATKQLYAPKPYNEQILATYYSKEDAKLIVFGKRYHYAFDVPKQLLTALTSNYASKLTAAMREFHVNKQNVITGKLYLFLNEQEKEVAANEGFREVRSGMVRSDFFLSGTRYDSGGVQPPKLQYNLNKKYVVRITTEDVRMTSAVILTPFKVVQDVVSIGVGIVMAPILLPILKQN